MRRGSTYFFASVIFLYGSLLGLAYMLQHSFILHPKKLDKTFQFQFDFQFEEKQLPIDDGTVHFIHAYTTGESKGAVLYFHGNADNLDRWGHVSEDFLSRQYDVIMMDYRGFGKSDGRASEENMYIDARSIYNYALQVYCPEDIIIYGRSIGSGVASQLASEREADQLLLETPFYSLEDVVKKKYPFALRLFKLNFEFPNYRNIASIDIPVHIFHGTKDRVVPFDSAEQLKLHLSPLDSFLRIEGGGHKNLPSFNEYKKRLDKILAY